MWGGAGAGVLGPTSLYHPQTLIRAILILFVYICIYFDNTFLSTRCVLVRYFLETLLARLLTGEPVCSLAERFGLLQNKFETYCCVQYFLRILFRRWKHFPGKVILAELFCMGARGWLGWREGQSLAFGAWVGWGECRENFWMGVIGSQPPQDPSSSPSPAPSSWLTPSCFLAQLLLPHIENIPTAGGCIQNQAGFLTAAGGGGVIDCFTFPSAPHILPSSSKTWCSATWPERNRPSSGLFTLSLLSSFE